MKTLLFLSGLLLFSFSVFAQARLTIYNNSSRQLTVKVMNNFERPTLHEKVVISANSSATIYFSETGRYFIKSMAVMAGKEPLYKKGNPFRVYNGTDGYSVLTITYSIKENSAIQADGKAISKKEFDQD